MQPLSAQPDPAVPRRDQQRFGNGPGLMALGLLAGLNLLTASTPAVAADPAGDAERGAYLVIAAGCAACHTDSDNEGVAFAGGHRLETPYGVFVTPNITADDTTGIGTWTDTEFVAALREGTRPDGSVYYPSFPYPSYAGMTERDALDIKAWLDAQPPVSQTNGPHELNWYVPGRWAMRIWRTLFAPWEYPADPAADAEWQRGAYLVRHMGHCGECHTPRNVFGALDTAMELAGAATGTGDDRAPNITADREHGIGQWTEDDLEFFLEVGMYPDGDFVGGDMTAVIDDNTALLTAEDRQAIARFLRSLPGR
jgi:mono/diheme cytochrome c family protein